MATQEYPLVELKGSAFTLPVIHLRTLDLDYIATELKNRLSQSVSFFAHAPVVLDLGEMKNTKTTCDFRRLKELLRSVDLIAVGVHRCPEALHIDAVQAELAILKGGVGKNTSSKKVETTTKSPAPQDPHPKSMAPRVRVIDKPVRSGQQIYAQNGDLIVLGPVNAGAEVIADGDIHIYAPLRGRALAGVMGDVTARIFTLSLEAQLISIAGHYKLFDEEPREKVYKGPAQAYLEDNRVMVIPIP